MRLALRDNAGGKADSASFVLTRDRMFFANGFLPGFFFIMKSLPYLPGQQDKIIDAELLGTAPEKRKAGFIPDIRSQWF